MGAFKMRLLYLALFSIVLVNAKLNPKNVVIEDIQDVKDMKKLFRTKNNVLVLFTSNLKDTSNTVKAFREAAQQVKGQATAVLIDCSNSESKKLCKKLKASPSPVVLKHYKDGDFHKDYDRQLTVSSMVNFLRDPTGDIPWEEDANGSDVIHIHDPENLSKLLKREGRPIMIMFYAPWCGFCKQLKPDYSAVAAELKPNYVMAAIDVNRPENSRVRKMFNITGFPTLLYFEHGALKQTYEGENNKAALIAFMKDPNSQPIVKPKEGDWSAESDTEIVHLTTDNFEAVLNDEKSALVMFHAPWCGHCKKMKPEYEKAAITMKEKKIAGILAAVDATKEGPLAAKYGVKGYPTVKYFSFGKLKFDANVRDAEKIVNFMKNPTEPPPPPPPEKSWEDEESDVIHLDESNFKTVLKKKKHVLVMFYAPWCGHCKKAKPEFVTAAENFKDDPRIELAAVDCTKHSAVCSVYSVKGFPTFKYFSYLKTERGYDGGRTSDDFIKFLNDPDASPEKPEEVDFGTYPGSESIVKLTDSNFHGHVTKVDRILVMFYAPWCGHCTKMKPQYSEAAKRVADENVGLLGAVDSTVNEDLSRKFNIKGFPTLKFFVNGKYHSDYDGKRTAEDMYEFVKNNGKSKDSTKDEL